MDMFSTWLAFLTKELIERCSLRLKQECAGCQNNLLSPILHFHNHFNLLELLKKYQSVCCLEMDIQKLYNNFIVRFGLFDIPQDEFIRLGSDKVLCDLAHRMQYTMVTISAKKTIRYFMVK